MSEKRLICMNGGITEMTDRQVAHEEAKENVLDKIMSLFKENDITIIEAEFIMRKIIDGAASKARWSEADARIIRRERILLRRYGRTGG